MEHPQAQNKEHANRNPDSVRQSRGFVFIIILAVLTILVLIGVVFVLLARLERTHSANYVDSVSARLLAKSGIETALIYMPQYELTDQGLPPTVYGIEFNDANQNGRYDPSEDTVVNIQRNDANVANNTPKGSAKNAILSPGSISDAVKVTVLPPNTSGSRSAAEENVVMAAAMLAPSLAFGHFDRVKMSSSPTKGVRTVAISRISGRFIC